MRNASLELILPFASGGINVGLAIGPSGQLFAGISTVNIYMLGWFDDSWQVTDSAGNLTATHLATGNHLDWTAFAISLEVPEPASGGLIAIGLAGALLRRRVQRVKEGMTGHLAFSRRRSILSGCLLSNGTFTGKSCGIFPKWIVTGSWPGREIPDLLFRRDPPYSGK